MPSQPVALARSSPSPAGPASKNGPTDPPSPSPPPSPPSPSPPLPPSSSPPHAAGASASNATTTWIADARIISPCPRCCRELAARSTCTNAAQPQEADDQREQRQRHERESIVAPVTAGDGAA